MTVVTLKLKERTEIFHFNPPLPPAKEIEILNFWRVINFPWRITCEIVDPFSHYTNLERDKVEPARLIAFAGCITEEGKFFPSTCPEKFPTVKAQKK